MCGMDWYRQQMEIAENDIERLQQLLQMLEERYQLSQAETSVLKNQANPAIMAIYREIVSRKNSLLMINSPQAQACREFLINLIAKNHQTCLPVES